MPRKLSIFTWLFLSIITVRICSRQLFTDKQFLFIMKSSIEVHACFIDISTITDYSSIVSRLKVVHAWCYVIASHRFAKQVVWCMSLYVRLLEAVQCSRHHMTNTEPHSTLFPSKSAPHTPFAPRQSNWKSESHFILIQFLVIFSDIMCGFYPFHKVITCSQFDYS